ncbi:hypothetical protein K1X84_04690 [bacterium]|nr:hypothetical protein [bacterium]
MGSANRFRLTWLFFLPCFAYVLNLLTCHPIQTVKTESQPLIEWEKYQNPKYGFRVDIPAGWSATYSAIGIELSDPLTDGYISIKALVEPSQEITMPLDEHLIRSYSERHPYLEEPFSDLHELHSSSGLIGHRLRAHFINDYDYETAEERRVHRAGDSSAVVAYMPCLFPGDHYCSTVEFFSTGTPDSLVQGILNSYQYMFKTFNQRELLSMNLISSMDMPDRAIWYVGETRGFTIDFNGDGQEELLVSGIRRSSDSLASKCFVKLFKKSNETYKLILEKEFSGNTFQESDIQLINIDNAPGYEVFLRFTDYGNEWGQNSTALVHYDGQQFRVREFGAFAEARDINHDGKEEIITAIKNYFQPGSVSTWYDIYCYENGNFVESNQRFKNYFKDVMLPSYKEQIENARTEMLESKVQSFRVSAYYQIRRLEKYVKWSEKIANGESLTP